MPSYNTPFSHLQIGQRLREATPPFLTKHATWKGVSAQLLRVVQPTSLDYQFVGTAHTLSLQDFSRKDGETRISDGPVSTTKDLRHKLTFLPKEAQMAGWSDFKQRLSTAVVVALDPNPQDPEFQEFQEFQNIPPMLHFQNETLQSTMLKVQALLEDDGPNDSMYAELLGLLLFKELARANLSKSRSGVARGGLSPRQLKLIKDYVQENLGSDISLSALSSLVGLSRFHFIRSFKEATGQSPYQFLLAERVSRSKQLLMETGLSVNEVAAASGFNSTLQLSRAFRRFTGQSATEFRRSISQ